MVNDASESLGDSRGEALALARIARSAAAEAAKRAGDLGAGDVVLSETQGANADAKMRHVIGAAREALTTSAFAPGQAVSAASSLAAAVSLLFGQHLDNPSKHANDVHELVTDVFERAVNELCESDDQNGALKVPLAVLRGAVRLALAVPAPVFVESGVANSSRHERLIAALEKGLYAHAKATAACTSLACHMQYSVIFSEQLAAYVVRNGAVDAGCLACEWSTLHESEGSFRTNVVRFQINLLQQLVATRQAKYARDLCGRRLAAHELEEPHLHVATPFVQLAYDLIAIDKMVMRGQMEVAKIYVKNVATRPRAKRLTAFENVQQAQQAVIAARESLIAGEQCSDGSLPTPPPLLTMSRESYVRLLGDAACRCLVRRGLADVAYGWLVSDWELPPKELDVEARKLLKLLPRHGESRMPVKAEDAADAEASAVMRAMRGLLLCDIGEGSTTAVDAELLGILGLAIPTHMSEVDPIDVDHPENLPGIAQLRAIASASASTRQGHYHNLSLDIRIPDTSRDASGGAYMISNLSEGIWAIEHLQRAASSSSDGICVIGADAEWRPETNWQSGEGEHAALDEDAQPLGSDGIPPLAMPGGSHRVATLQLAVKDAAFVFDMPALAAAYAADGSGHNSTTFALGLKALFGGSEEGEGHACVLIGHGLGEDLRRVRRGYGATFDGALLSFAKCLDLSPLRLMLTAQGSSNSSKNGRVSLSRMVEEVIGKPLDKTQRLTDWEKRPLEEAGSRLKVASWCRTRRTATRWTIVCLVRWRIPAMVAQ